MRNYSSFRRGGHRLAETSRGGGPSPRRSGFGHAGGQKSGGTFHRRQQTGPKPKRQGSTGAYINPQKFINKALAPKEREVFVPKHSFADFGFSKTLERNITRLGYERPTPIQDEAIPYILEGRDLIGLARTGTGKTAAFALPIIHKLRDAEIQKTVLVIAPTRELAGQIDEDFRAFSEHLKVRTALCVGGVSIPRQRAALAQHPQIIIGTPGRLVDLLNQRVLRLERATTLVLDEVDRMLDMGFIRDIRLLIAALPKERQSLCFSATMNPDIQKLLDQMLRNPVTVSVKESEAENLITQDIIVANSKEQKIEILKELLRKTHV
ncbi:MAG: DEAD/DEAH box helicase, partial [Candidatus Wolfebacteria bacterium]|nr:DEAD/DEAH box helicase [Candidatus Wolfebacteria bacterium]